MNCPPTYIFEGNEMGNYELTWSGLTVYYAHELDQYRKLDRISRDAHVRLRDFYAQSSI